MNPIPLADLPDVMAPADVASALGLSLHSVYEALHRGDLPSIRIGRRFLVSKHELIRKFSSLSREKEESAPTKSAPSFAKPGASKGGRDGSASSAG